MTQRNMIELIRALHPEVGEDGGTFIVKSGHGRVCHSHWRFDY